MTSGEFSSPRCAFYGLHDHKVHEITCNIDSAGNKSVHLFSFDEDNLQFFCENYKVIHFTFFSPNEFIYDNILFIKNNLP